MRCSGSNLRSKQDVPIHSDTFCSKLEPYCGLPLSLPFDRLRLPLKSERFRKDYNTKFSRRLIVIESLYDIDYDYDYDYDSKPDS